MTPWRSVSITALPAGRPATQVREDGTGDQRTLSPVKILPENGKDFIYLVLPVRFKNEG